MVRGNGRRPFRAGNANRGADRGRGIGGRGRGAWSERGRGRGQFRPDEELDFSLEMYANAPLSSHVVGSPATGAPRQGPRKRGRGRGRFDTPGQQSNNRNMETTPSRARGRGGAAYVSPRGRGRGWAVEGIGSSKKMSGGGPIRPNTTLSNLLYQERPLLRPIIFVPSVYTRVLFQNDDDELLKPVMEDVDDTAESHLPTADQISRVFSASNMPVTNSDNEGDEEEQIEVVNFNDIGTLFDTIGNTPKSMATAHEGHWADSPKFTGASTKKVRTTPMDVKDLANMVNTTLSREIEDFRPKAHLPSNVIGPNMVDTDNLFYIDPKPTSVPVRTRSSSIQPRSVLNEADDDDVIVYVAPNPRISSTLSKEIQDRPGQIASSTADTLHQSHFSHTSFSTISSSLQFNLSTSTIQQAVEPINLPATSEIATTPNTTIPEPPPFSSIPFSFSKPSLVPDTTETALSDRGTSNAGRLRVPPVTTPRQAKVWKQRVYRAGKRRNSVKKYRAASFGAFGAMREEALLHRIDKERDERYDKRRRGDSDLEWADTDDDDDERKTMPEGLEHDIPSVLSSTLEKGKGKAEEQGDEGHGMDVDSDLDMSTMTGFVQGLLGPDAGKHVTMDDVRDQEIMKMEDEDQSQSSGSDDEEVDEALEAEEARFMNGHDLGPESAADDDGEDDDDIENSFQARLQRIRAKAGALKNSAGFCEWSSEDEDEADILERYSTWADEDDDFIQHIHDILDENEDVLKGKDGQQRKNLFASSCDHDNMEGSVSPARRKKDKYKDIPPDLRALWEKDRMKKADRRKARELERLATAADPLKKNKGGKKGRKAMSAAASSDPTIVVLPNRVIDMTTLVQQIRRFIADVGGPSSMSLPPTTRETRKSIHEMAQAFGLKSVSKGRDDARYTTLIKTTRTGNEVKEAKVSRILRRSGGAGARGDSFYPGGRNGRVYVKVPKQREGDEVGKAAPKLDESNVGFRLLSNMGWAEGDRIGASMKGLEAPLQAIIKTSKLGLGAKRGTS